MKNASVVREKGKGTRENSRIPAKAAGSPFSLLPFPLSATLAPPGHGGSMSDKVRFFKTPADLRWWFAGHRDTETELWIGYYKKDSGRPSVTWPETVDEALCVGWIDGIRKRIDDVSYKIRFTPRRTGSIWSAVNIGRVAVLKAEGRMGAPGLAAFADRR